MLKKFAAILFYKHFGLFAVCSALAAALAALPFLRTEAAREVSSPNATVFMENFDNVTEPTLPAGWTTSGTGQNLPFTTLSVNPDTPPNCVYTNDPNTAGSSQLTTPTIALSSARHKLIFQHSYQTDYEFDGGVLEISINGGAFQDILAAGGSFITGGYDTALLGGSPLGTRQAWTGQLLGYITTKVNLPASTSNQNIQLRWRMASDPMEDGAGWRIDNVEIYREEVAPAPSGFIENFDNVAAPQLPAGWTTSTTNSVPAFRTGTALSQTVPNAAFVNDPNQAGTSDLISPSIPIGSNPSRLIFRQAFASNTGADGGILEIKIGNGAFQDIIAAGGVFIEGGYSPDAQLTSASNPLNGRRAWTGSSSNNIPPRFINTIVNLPATAANQSIQFRWRQALDSTPGLGYGGWWIDSVRVEDYAPQPAGFVENFDAVTAPQLPAGWTASSTGTGSLTFATLTATPDSPPNAVFTNNPATVSTSELVSPSIRVGGNFPKLIFRHNYNLENGFDGGVLEIKINNGNFQDILAAGGSFVSNGYNAALSTGSMNPLPGRMAWTGNSNGYLTTEINLPSAAYGQNVQFRWLRGTDSVQGGAGWRIDSVQVTNAISGENAGTISIPASGAASAYPSEITVSGHAGLISGVIVNLDNFSHTAPDDVDLMLVAPNGRRVILMSDVGGNNAVNNLSLSIDDSAANSLPDDAPLTSGIYKPTNFGAGDAFPAPAPTGAPTGATLSALNGGEPNGVWKLFLVDDNGENAGTVAGGWNVVVKTSPNLINIPVSGTSMPYPSEVLISGLQGSVTKAVVTLTNFSHLAPDDVDLMLVAPNGRRVILMSDVGGNTEVGGVNLVFDDAATVNLPDNAPIVSGNYKPTNYEPGDAFPSPAPQGAPTGTTLNAFYGSPANGVWRLYVVDDNGENFGSVAEGFSLSLETSTTACSFALSPTGQGFPITGGNGSFNITMPAGCPWSATTNSNFINITSNTSGEGTGAINYTVQPNMTGGRVAYIVVSNGISSESFLIQQPSGCPFSLGNDVQSVSANGGTGNVSVTAGSTCIWQATSNVSWIQPIGGSQTGNGTANFTVLPNPNAALRTGTITIGARVLTVNQSGALGRRFDFDGDGKSDVSVYRPSSGIWYIQNSQNNALSGAQFGAPTDKLVPADYDGDRKTDFAVFRNGIWFILESQTNTMRSLNFGLATDIPIAGDYDGDGRSDAAVWRASNGNWYIARSASNTIQGTFFGAENDQPVPADYDGDGKMDIAVFRRGASAGWFILQSTNSSIINHQFGTNGDIAVPADFDGDGRDNVAIFRPSNGTWYTSTNPSINYGAIQFGAAGDVPVAADYNGDNRTDIAVFRSGVWYILLSGSGTLRTEHWGLATDMPVPAAYNRQ